MYLQCSNRNQSDTAEIPPPPPHILSRDSKALAKRSSKLKPSSQLRLSWASFGHPLGLSWIELAWIWSSSNFRPPTRAKFFTVWPLQPTQANSRQVVLLLLYDYAMVFKQLNGFLENWPADASFDFVTCFELAWVGSTVWLGLNGPVTRYNIARNVAHNRVSVIYTHVTTLHRFGHREKEYLINQYQFATLREESLLWNCSWHFCQIELAHTLAALRAGTLEVDARCTCSTARPSLHYQPAPGQWSEVAEETWRGGLEREGQPSPALLALSLQAPRPVSSAAMFHH